MHQLKVGQTLLFESSSVSNKRVRGKVTVKSVGRKWAEIEGTHTGRISVETLEVDAGSYSSPGECFLSKEHWMERTGRRIVWDALKNAMRNVPPADVTLAQVLEAAKLLGLPVEAPNIEFA